MKNVIAIRYGERWVLANSWGKVIFSGKGGAGFATPQKARIAYWYYLKSKK